MNKNILVWDMGGTKCAAGIVEHNAETGEFSCKKQTTVKLSDTSSLEHLIERIESELNIKTKETDAVCMGAAGQFNGESLIHEHAYPYPMDIARVAAKQKWPNYAVVHDYTPIVCATFTSYAEQPENIKQLNHCTPDAHGRRVALGIGTGLGLKDGVLFPNGDFWLGRNEMGHIGITVPPHAESDELKRHAELVRFLQQHHQPVTFEKILSGSGVALLYEFFHPNKPRILPEEVGAHILEGAEPHVLKTFAWYLGLFVGTVQLSFMPEGGIWITGGVALHLLPAFDLPDFAQGIRTSPAYLAQRDTYPLSVLCSLDHALMGGAYYAAKRLIK